MVPRLSSAVLLVRDVRSSLRFWAETLGMAVISHTERFAEVDAGVATLRLRQVDRCAVARARRATAGLTAPLRASEAQLSKGYSPLLHFQVDDVDELLGKVMMAGATMDGAVKHSAHGKVRRAGAQRPPHPADARPWWVRPQVAVFRSPDGHMLSVYEMNHELREG